MLANKYFVLAAIKNVNFIYSIYKYVEKSSLFLIKKRYNGNKIDKDVKLQNSPF